MQNAAGGGTSAPFGVRNDSYRSIISDLVSLVERVRESMKLIELAVAAETPADRSVRSVAPEAPRQRCPGKSPPPKWRRLPANV
jgi:hypothetical protein